MNQILLKVQIVLYVCTVFIISVPTDKINITIFQLCSAGASLLLKVYRQVKLGHLKQLFLSQIKFFIAYLLTGVQIAFSIQSNQQLINFEIQNKIRIFILVFSTINYSILCHKKLITLSELIFYEFGIAVQILNQVSTTMFAVNFFDKTFDDQIQKDFILLQTATGIAVGALILDLVFRAYEEKQKQKE